ncbi:hemerythrin [Betaproteobacteria bacterium]|nr:hemerythrin [Betaproteobacteria bacterium]
MPKDFNWSDDFSVGIEEIDEQHKKLVMLVGKLHQAITNKAGTKACGFILNELVDYTVTHFSLEETMMRLALYPDYEEHCVQHKALVDEVSALQQKIAAGQVAISFELLHFLRNWLTKHIMREDMQYGVYFRERERIRQEGVNDRAERSAGTENQPKKKRRWWKFW